MLLIFENIITFLISVHSSSYKNFKTTKTKKKRITPFSPELQSLNHNRPSTRNIENQHPRKSPTTIPDPKLNKSLHFVTDVPFERELRGPGRVGIFRFWFVLLRSVLGRAHIHEGFRCSGPARHT